MNEDDNNMTTPPHLIEQTSRSRKLSRLRAYYDGTQYRGKPDFWTGKTGSGKVVPVRERAPHINYRLTKAAVQEIVKFTLGEGRFPRVKVEEEPLTAAESETLSTFITKMVDHCQIQPIWEEVLTYGLATGAYAEILSLQEGRFVSTLHNAEHCEPTLDAFGDVQRITICYRYCKEEYADGRMQVNHYYYRREIDAVSDTIYEPAECNPSGADDPEWRVASVVNHGLGFCPVLWPRNGKLAHSPDIDGCSIYEGEDSEIDSLNLGLSQAARGINYWGAPQPWETGVTPGMGPAATGRVARPQQDSQRERYGVIADGKMHVTDDDPARKAGADEIWTYEDEKAKVGLLETSGAAFKASMDHVNAAKGRFKEATGVVLMSPEALAGKGDVSAKMLAMLHAPLLGTVANVRSRWWPSYFAKSICMRLRMIAVMGAIYEILIPGVDALPLAKFMRDGRWINPHLTPIWGAHFTPTGKEVKEDVDAAKAAYDAGFIKKETAAGFVASHFGVQDVEAELRERDAEGEEETTETDGETNGSDTQVEDVGAIPGGSAGKIDGSTVGPSAPAATQAFSSTLTHSDASTSDAARTAAAEAPPDAPFGQWAWASHRANVPDEPDTDIETAIYNQLKRHFRSTNRFGLPQSSADMLADFMANGWYKPVLHAPDVPKVYRGIKIASLEELAVILGIESSAIADSGSVAFGRAMDPVLGFSTSWTDQQKISGEYSVKGKSGYALTLVADVANNPNRLIACVGGLYNVDGLSRWHLEREVVGLEPITIETIQWVRLTSETEPVVGIEK